MINGCIKFQGNKELFKINRIQSEISSDTGETLMLGHYDRVAKTLTMFGWEL